MYFERQYNKCEIENDTKRMYNITKTQLGWKTGGPPESFLVNGKPNNNPTLMANMQLKFFTEKVKKLIAKLPRPQGDPLAVLRAAMERWSKAGNRETFSLKTITEREMIGILGELGNSTTFGHDKLDALSLKVIASNIYKPLTHIINRSILSSTFCNRWKIAKVIPLHKGKGAERLAPESYRPISLLPVTAKLAEKVIQRQIMDYMTKSGQFNSNLHAYQKYLGTTTSLLQLNDVIFQATDENMTTALMSVDESAAFDCVSTDILAAKLKMYNFSNEAIDWMLSYLSNRTQFITINTKDSEMAAVCNGVPQGSVLGPVLYNIYVNEMPDLANNPNCNEPCHNENEKLFGPNCKKCGQIPMYAEDASFIVSSKSRENNQARIEEMLDKITFFLNNNNLTINAAKTTLCEVMIKQKRTKMKGQPPKLNVINDKGQEKTIEAEKSCKITRSKCSEQPAMGGPPWRKGNATQPETEARGPTPHRQTIAKEEQTNTGKWHYSKQNHLSYTSMGGTQDTYIQESANNLEQNSQICAKSTQKDTKEGFNGEMQLAGCRRTYNTPLPQHHVDNCMERTAISLQRSD